jgi:hypothetical protein
MPCGEIIAVYSENYTKPVNTNAEFVRVKAGGAYSYHCVSKG